VTPHTLQRRSCRTAGVVARFSARLRWPDVPPEVAEKAKLCLIDTLAAMIAGRVTSSSAIAAGVAAAWCPAPEASLVVGGRAGVPGVAFANAVAANALDIDDCGIYTWGHPGAQVVPVALALAEQGRLSGRELLTAIVVGYEVAFRAGRCLNHELTKICSAKRDFRACGSWGSVACAAITSHVQGLDPMTTSQALGIAEYHSPDLPMMRDIDHPSMVKHGVGVGAVTGIMAAELARQGFTGIVSSLELETYRAFVDDIGVNYLLPHGITWKRFSSCAWTHPALLAAESLVARHGFSHDDIDGILVETYPDAVRLGTALPRTTEEAQFNLAWPLAALLVDGEVGPTQVTEGRLEDPEITALCARVEARVSADLTRLYYLSEANDPEGKDAAIVTVTLRDGRVLNSGVVEHILYPKEPWGHAQMRDKFAWLTSTQAGETERAELLTRLEDVEQIADIGELVREVMTVLCRSKGSA
jgi:2-methylcitrate dehydratase PrpD